MKNSLKTIFFGITAAVCVLSLTACNQNQTPPSGSSDLAQKQITQAQSTYESFYKKNGLFSAAPSTAAVAAAYAEDDETTVTFDTVRKILAEYPANSSNMIKSTFNSYVADIFAYSQVQTSIIEEFGEESLTDVYALTYDGVDWESDTTGFGTWIESTKLLSAAFAGTDLETGNVYCTQAHISQNVKALANLEYYYNSDGDMGVTTINRHDNGKFEYHYCSAGTYEILQAYGTVNATGEIMLTSFAYWTKNGVVDYCPNDDKTVIFGFVQSEISRIEEKIDELQEQNERERTLDGTEEEGKEHVGTCSVKLDFSVLSTMLIK